MGITLAIRIMAEVLGVITTGTTTTGTSPYIQSYVSSGISALAHMATGAKDGMFVGLVPSLEKWVNHIRLLLMRIRATEVGKASSGFSSCSRASSPACSEGLNWSTEDFINAHKKVVSSGKFNFEGCRIPIPTAIRHDRIREALGASASSRKIIFQQWVLKRQSMNI